MDSNTCLSEERWCLHRDSNTGLSEERLWEERLWEEMYL
jgi:hypothetical protein